MLDVNRMCRLTGPRQRAYAKSLIDDAPDGWIVTVKEPTRTLDQNAKLWAMLTDIAKAAPEGITATPDDWKAMAMNACGWECQFLQGLDGRPFPIGFRSSRLTVGQMSELIEFLYEYGSRHGVRWSEPIPEGME